MRVVRLIGVELSRLVSRRLSLVAVLVVVAFLGLLQLSINAQLHESSPAGVAERRAELVEAQRDWDANHEQQEAECRQQGGSAANCEIPRPSEEDWYVSQQSFADIVDPSVQSVAYLGGIAVFVIAASFIGAEFTSGAIGNWLSFVPRRDEVFLAKLVAVVLAAAVIGFVLAVGVIAAAAAMANFHQLPVGGLPGLFATAGRTTAAVVVLGVCGFVVALLGRRTVVALGAFLAYGVVAFIRNALLAPVSWAQRLSPWTPEVNLTALVDNGTTYYLTNQDGTDVVERTVSASSGGLYLAVLALALAAVGWFVFRRRDVT